MHRHFGNHGHGPRFGRHAFGMHRHGMRHGRPGRFFDHGDLRTVILALLAEKPSHGYELIKALEEKTGGAYSPSPGVIYPTLTLLEEQGLAVAETTEGGRKAYTLTEAGRTVLAQDQAQASSLLERMAQAAASSAAFSPKVMRARENLRTALRLKLASGLTAEQVSAVADALDAAAKAVEAA